MLHHVELDKSLPCEQNSAICLPNSQQVLWFRSRVPRYTLWNKNDNQLCSLDMMSVILEQHKYEAGSIWISMFCKGWYKSNLSQNFKAHFFENHSGMRIVGIYFWHTFFVFANSNSESLESSLVVLLCGIEWTEWASTCPFSNSSPVKCCEFSFCIRNSCS